MSTLVEVLTENEGVKDIDFPIEVKAYSAGTQIIPTEATITVKDGGGTALVEDQDMTIASGTMTYNLDSANTADLLENGIIEITYVYTLNYKAVFLWDCVLNRLKCNVVDDDLKKHFPQLADEIWSGTSNYDGQIQEAFKQIKRDVKNKGKRPHMILDGGQIRELIITKTFEIIFFTFAKNDTDDIWWFRYEQMRDKYLADFAMLVIVYDTDEDGIVDTDETLEPIGQPTLQR